MVHLSNTNRYARLKLYSRIITSNKIVINLVLFFELSIAVNQKDFDSVIGILGRM